MKATIELGYDELKEFIAWKEDKQTYKHREKKLADDLQDFAKKATWAIEDNPLCPGECVIVSQRHASDLIEMAAEILDG